MPTDLLTIAGTLGAALVAGAISYLAGRGMKTHEWKLTLAKEELASRKALYAAFLAEAHRLVVKATVKKVEAVAELDILNRQYAEITLVGCKKVTDAATQIFDSVIMAQQNGEATPEAMAFHSRKEAFVLEARNELQSLRGEA
jgi:hypothetical protein